MNADAKCPGCGSDDAQIGYRLTNQPVVQNYRFASAADAMKVPRGDIALGECGRCGLIFNAQFEASRIPYDEGYENRQGCSPAFAAHVDHLAADLVARHGLRAGSVLEIGCGKGDFLRALDANGLAAGDGYDTTYDGPAEAGGLRFHQRYVTARDIRTRYDLIVCRHVIEHVAGIGAFLSDLREIARAAGDPPVVIETPAFDWIVKEGAFWDIFYEHCNYFTCASLASLVRAHGFEILRHAVLFGDQYQLLELTPASRATAVEGRTRSDVTLRAFATAALAQRSRLEARLNAIDANQAWAVWGAGAKGVALVTQLPLTPRCVVDSNPAKQGCFVPGSAVPVVAPDDPSISEIAVMIAANPNYLDEISKTLRDRGFQGTVLAV